MLGCDSVRQTRGQVMVQFVLECVLVDIYPQKRWAVAKYLA
jgi:hypothetical protein